MARVVIHGSGSMARLALAYLADAGHEVVAFSGPRESADDEHESLPRLPFDELVATFPPDRYALFIAPRPTADRNDRPAAIEGARAAGYALVSYVHPSASIWPGTVVGENSLILERVVVQPWASLGVDVTIWSGCHVGHETVIGNHCFLSPGTVVSGNVIMGPCCHIGPNAAIRNAITLAAGTRVAANATLRTSTETGVVYGTPASSHPAAS